MVSLDSTTVFPKFNVDAKPFEMYLPTTQTTTFLPEALSSESSDSSTCEFPETLYLDDLNDDITGVGLFIPPDDDIRDRIIKQVEFYFSDENLTKDAFLLKHVKKNKEGSVNLKLISSFKKVKTLTKDWRVVAYSLKSSDKLVVNESGTKVRRKDVLPPYDETTPSRTVIAMNLPFDFPTVENVSESFSRCGEISLTRILRPGAQIPPDIKQFVNKHPGIGTCVCAVIEFASTEGAQKAVAEMGGKNNDWRSMHVVEMVKGAKKATTGVAVNKKESPETDEGKKEEDKKKKQKNKKRSPKNDGGRKGDGMMSSSPVFTEVGAVNGKQIFRSPNASPEMMMMMTSNGENNGSPWVHRRRMAAKENGNCSKTLIPEGVIRLPKGPDGTNGFHRGSNASILVVG